MNRRFLIVLAVAAMAHARPLAAASVARLPATAFGAPPGVVVAISARPETDYLGSPSIVILPNGSYVAAHDIFGTKAAQRHTARVFGSRDRGATWTQFAHVRDQFWPLLFVHRGALYMIGTSKEYGDIVLRRSLDGGHTWTEPRDEKTGVLFRGTYHGAPVPIVSHAGRLWRGFEHYTGLDGKWSGRHFEAFAISVPAQADLLAAASWTKSNGVAFDGDWVKGDRTGWLEGNLVIAPDGHLVNILRVNATEAAGVPFELDGPARGIPRYEVAAVMDVGPDPATIGFVPERGFFQFPGSQSKFTIRFDPVSKRYWSLVQKITAPDAGRGGTDFLPTYQRNVLRLTSSADLRTWIEHATVLRWCEGQLVSRRDRVGFQYVDWQFDGDDLIAVCRTAWGGQSYHNSNYITFHRIQNFRALTPADSPPDLAPRAPASPR